jgi:hypothetical protein
MRISNRAPDAEFVTILVTRAQTKRHDSGFNLPKARLLSDGSERIGRRLSAVSGASLTDYMKKWPDPVREFDAWINPDCSRGATRWFDTLSGDSIYSQKVCRAPLTV